MEMELLLALITELQIFVNYLLKQPSHHFRKSSYDILPNEKILIVLEADLNFSPKHFIFGRFRKFLFSVLICQFFGG